MKASTSKVIIANSSHATLIENLRREAYHNSTGFKIIDETEFEKYCKWCQKDEQGIVLIALNERDEIVSCLRGNIYHSQMELENSNINFTNNSDGFAQYPVLDMTFAATSADHLKNGLLSALRYYMYLLHKHSVKSISGSCVKNSSIYKTLEKLGYMFKDIPNIRKDLMPIDLITIAKIDVYNLDFAINYLKERYADTIKNYPLIIT